MRGQLPIGSVLAGYRIIELIGEGSGGAVYLAEHEETGERVALKVLADELARDDRFRRRFLRESTIAAGLRHPHVVRNPRLRRGRRRGVPGDALHRGGRPARSCSGATARSTPRRRCASWPRWARRSTRPTPVASSIVTSSPRTSWSTAMARRIWATSASPSTPRVPSSLTGEQSFVGTIAYVAPEQIKGEQVDGRADVYALTCVLYEALTGRAPFERESELAVLFAHLHEQAPRASDVRPELPARPGSRAADRDGQGAQGALRELRRAGGGGARRARRGARAADARAGAHRGARGRRARRRGRGAHRGDRRRGGARGAGPSPRGRGRRLRAGERAHPAPSPRGSACPASRRMSSSTSAPRGRCWATSRRSRRSTCGAARSCAR